MMWDSHAASGGAMTGGATVTAVGAGVPDNAVGAFGGRLFGRSNSANLETELATLRQELAGLNARHRELTGKPLPPRPQPRETSPDALVPSLRSELDDVRALVAQHETANRPQGQSIVPRVADRTDERAFVQQQFEDMPAAGQSFKGRQGLASRKEQQRLLTEYYSRPGDKAGTPDPWGGEPRSAHGAPLQHKEIMQAQVDYENAAKQVVANNKELVSLRQQRLTASRSQMRGALSDAQKKIKELEDQNSALNNVIMRANSIMKKGL
jgi:hypothetical protein